MFTNTDERFLHVACQNYKLHAGSERILNNQHKTNGSYSGAILFYVFLPALTPTFDKQRRNLRKICKYYRVMT